MATIKNIGSSIELGSNWVSVSLGDLNSFYLIGIKNPAKGATDTIDPKDVKSLSFEVGIDSGATINGSNAYLTLNYITLDFNAFTSSDKILNESTALVRCLNYPSTFYIRPTEIFTKDGKKHTTGISSITVNVNAVKLQ